MTAIHPPPRVGPGRAVRALFTRYADFRGRSTRAEYWWVALLHGLLVVALWGASRGALHVAALQRGPAVLPPLLLGLLAAALLLALALGTLVPLLALTVRRLRDAGLAPLLVLLGLVPTIGGLVLAALLSRPSAPLGTPPGTAPVAAPPRPTGSRGGRAVPPARPVDDGFAWGPVIAPPRPDGDGADGDGPADR